jgi:methionyl-tRNA formyltransferase
MRLIFVATGDIALPAFRYLLENGPLPLALVTQPDKPVGRHQTLTPPAIKVAALEAGIPIFQPEKISEAFEELSALEPEIIVVMAYGQILRNDILTLPSKAIINLHASLLPLYRGAACIQAAIDAGDSETGITAIHVVRALDAGDMICAKSIPITADETGGSLHDRLAELAPEVMAEALAKIEQGAADGVSQDPEKSTYISKLERDHGRIDWSMDATSIERRIRAYDPWPGTYTTILEGGKPKRVKIFPPTEISDRVIEPGVVVMDEGLFVGCGKGALKITSLQPEGSKRMSTSDYLRGKRPERFE